MDTLRKSFKTTTSSKNSPHDHEKHPMLGTDADDRHDFSTVRIDADDASDFCFSNQASNDDPPTRLITNFLHKQKASGGEISLDCDFELEELNSQNSSFNDVSIPIASGSSADESKLKSSSLSYRGKPPVYPSKESGVLKCSANSSFTKPNSSTLLRVKTKSRLMDAPPTSNFSTDGIKDGKISSNMLKRSGVLKSVNEDDEDPFLDEDLPEEFRSSSCGKWAIMQWVSLILILGALVCSLVFKRFRRQTVWKLHLWKWEVMILALICGRLVSGWFIRIIVFFIERSFLLRKRVLYFVYGLRKAVQNCLWLGLVLLTWHYMFDDNVERETKSDVLPKVTKVLICLFIATLIWLVKTLLVKVLASSFHVSTYFDRIQESLFNQYVIETLSGPPLLETINKNEEVEEIVSEVQKLQNAGAKIPNDLKAAALKSRSGNSEGGNRKSVRFSGMIGSKEISKQQDSITINHLHKLNQKNVSAWNMKKLIRMVKYGALTTLDEQLGQGGEDESAFEIRSEVEAKVAAKKIFNNVAKPGAKYIYLVDLMRFMREDEARKTMSLFEGADVEGRVSRRCLKNWVVTAFRERKALSLTLNDTKTAVNTLHRMINVIVIIIVIALSLLILNIATTHFFVFIGSQLVVAAFIFGNTLKMIFEAIIFLFVMHPFDVGDRCEIDGVQMIVEEMNILTTVFLRFDNQKMTYPNSILATKAIGNFYRSPDMGDAIDFCVHVSTPLEKLAIMKERIIGYMESRKDHWYPAPSVVLRDVDDMNRLRISIWMRQRINFQDMGARWDRRELVMTEMIRILKELNIEYRMLPLDVNVRDMPAITSSRLPSNWTTCS